jgi:hypothetical protein
MKITTLPAAPSGHQSEPRGSMLQTIHDVYALDTVSMDVMLECITNMTDVRLNSG